MIDYDKLKMAHELANEYAKKKYTVTSLSITVRFNAGNEIEYQADFCGVQAYEEIEQTNIDDLITKLKELTQSEPSEPGYIDKILEQVPPFEGSVSLAAGEYEVIDGVLYSVKKLDKPKQLTQPEPKYKDAWYVGNGGHPRCTKVLNQEGYAICDETDKEALGLHVTVYPTKAALIESQIEYWQSLREPKLCQACKDNPRFDCSKDYVCDHYEPEYCNVSGVKLDLRELEHPRQYADTLVAGLCAPSVGTTGCQHESDGYSYVTPNQTQMHSRKCIKCGVFYR